MLGKLREFVCRMDHWSRNYEYKIEGFTDTKISSTINYKPFPITNSLLFLFLIYVVSLLLPNIIPTQMVMNILFPIFLFEVKNTFIFFISVPITFFLYITLFTWILNKFDFYLLKNIIWKSSLVNVLSILPFFVFGFLYGYFFEEYRIFNIDIYWIFLVIFVGLYIYLQSVLEPTFITTITELLRQRDSNLISKETFIKIRDSLLSIVDDTNIPEESKKIIKDYIST